MTTVDTNMDGAQDTQADIKRLLGKYRALYDETMPDVERLREVIDHLLAPLGLIEDDLKLYVRDTERSISGHGVVVTYRTSYDRISWNSKALDGYAVVHPEIETFKKVTPVGPTVTIKVEQHD